ncbi:YgaP family membrane protein [Flavobacterium terrisoli]|uniref:YgaP family membrane protein n=1 Tax=Flavobacterium terrisoli TaxID=3242195 RepID=UPI0032EDD6E8
MKKNIGRTDSIIRIILGIIMIYLSNTQTVMVQILITAIAVALIFTALNGRCLLYVPFGFNTRKKTDT